MTGRVGRSQLAPPGHVGEVAERADHRDAGALVGLGQPVRQHRHLDAEQRACVDGRAEQRLVALVVGVRDQRDAGGQQLGAGRLDPQVLRRRRRGTRAGGRRRAAPGPRARPARPRSGTSRPTGSAPRRGRPRRAPGCAGTPAGRRPARRRVDRRVRQATSRPTGRARRHSASKAFSSSTVSRSHSSTKLRRETGTCCLPGCRGRLEVRVVRQRRVAADAVVVLHAALGGQAVVVPAHRVEDLAAAHPLEARDRVGVGVGEDVADVQRAADRRRRACRSSRPARGSSPGRTRIRARRPIPGSTGPRDRRGWACQAR